MELQSGDCFEVLIDSEPEKLWNKVVRVKCEKRLPKTKKQKKANWMTEEMVKIAKKRRKAKVKKDKELRKHLTNNFRERRRRSVLQ